MCSTPARSAIVVQVPTKTYDGMCLRSELKRSAGGGPTKTTEKDPAASGNSSSGHRRPRSSSRARSSSRTRSSCSRARSSSRDAQSSSASSPRQRSTSRSRSVQRKPPSTAEKSNGKSSKDHHQDNRARSRSATPSARGRRSNSKAPTSRSKVLPMPVTPKNDYDTPFDMKGRCHYHPNQQLARKKLTGGWKVLLDKCPKCLEVQYLNDSSDNRSVRSTRSTRSSRSIRSTRSRSKSSLRSGGGGDNNKSSSKSVGEGDISDTRSVISRLSNRSSSKPSSKRSSARPFDEKGYCHHHSHVRLAKKKFTGGWKILLDRCTECVAEENKDCSNKSVCSMSSRRSRSKSVCSRSSRGRSRSGSLQRSSTRKHSNLTSEIDDDDDGEDASAAVTSKKMSVKKMSYKDDTGKEGFYTGYVNDQYKPHGRGKCVYKDGTKYSGTWFEGSKVHGRTTSASSKVRVKKHKSSCSSSDRKEDASSNTEKLKENNAKKVANSEDPEVFENSDDFDRMWENERRKAKLKVVRSIKQEKEKESNGLMEYANMYNNVLGSSSTPANVVKDLPFVDLQGDAGQFTGEVNEKLMPHGKGCLVYDHGLRQEGNWTNGFFDDDSCCSA